MSNMHEWGRRWNIPPAAIEDLKKTLGVSVMGPECPSKVKTETGAQSHCRLQAAQQGDVLWRNNVGQIDPTTYDGKSFIRYGIANDSKKMNQYIKSSDLIGIRQVRITPDMVGSMIGQFVAREMKHPNWTYKGTAREEAQLRYLELVISMGGDACFSTGNY